MTKNERNHKIRDIVTIYNHGAMGEEALLAGMLAIASEFVCEPEIVDQRIQAKLGKPVPYRVKGGRVASI
jgi:hypothetical protein